MVNLSNIWDVARKIRQVVTYSILFLQEDDARSSGTSSPESTGSVETSISSHFGGMSYPSLFSSRPSGYGIPQHSVHALSFGFLIIVDLLLKITIVCDDWVSYLFRVLVYLCFSSQHRVLLHGMLDNNLRWKK